MPDSGAYSRPPPPLGTTNYNPVHMDRERERERERWMAAPRDDRYGYVFFYCRYLKLFLKNMYFLHYSRDGYGNRPHSGVGSGSGYNRDRGDYRAPSMENSKRSHGSAGGSYSSSHYPEPLAGHPPSRAHPALPAAASSGYSDWRGSGNSKDREHRRDSRDYPERRPLPPSNSGS